MRRVGRRRFLATVSAGVVGSSGCTSDGGDGNEGVVRPSGEPAVLPPPLECDDDSFDRLDQHFTEDDFAWGDHPDEPVHLRVPRTSYVLGEAVTISLTNAGQAAVETGHRSKYSVQLRTEAGWQDVRGARADVTTAYPDVLVTHDPGDGFEWTPVLTGEGLIGTFEVMRVCPALQPGRYRFVYWGLSGDAAVGVAFDVA